MRKAITTIRKTVQAKIVATSQKVRITFPKQLVSIIALEVELNGQKRILKQAEVWIKGDRFYVETVR